MPSALVRDPQEKSIDAPGRQMEMQIYHEMKELYEKIFVFKKLFYSNLFKHIYPSLYLEIFWIKIFLKHFLYKVEHFLD